MSMDLNDLLRALGQATNTKPASSGSTSEGDPLTDILGGLLGGGTQKSSTPQRQAKGKQAKGSIRREKGRAPQQPDAGGGLGGLLGGLLGGGANNQSGTSGNPLIAPLVDLVVNKTGLPPAIAQMAVTFAVTQILSSLSGKAQGGRRQGLEFNSLAQQLSTGNGVDSSFLSSTGLAQQFAEQSGLDLPAATSALEQTYGLISGPMAGGSLPTMNSTPEPAPIRQTKKTTARKPTASKSTKRKPR